MLSSLASIIDIITGAPWLNSTSPAKMKAQKVFKALKACRQAISLKSFKDLALFTQGTHKTIAET